MKRWPKLSAVCDCASHFIVSADVTKGPRSDSCEGPSITRSAHRRTRFRRGIFDGGYDSEGFDVLIREELGSHSVIPLKRGRKTRKWPKTKYRRQMKRRFFKRVYGQRWQIESAFSRYKQRPGSTLAATSWAGQKREIYTRVLTHDLMLLKRQAGVFYRARR